MGKDSPAQPAGVMVPMSKSGTADQPPDTLRVGLVNLINTLIKVSNNTSDFEVKKNIAGIRRVLWTILDEVTIQQIDSSTGEYTNALKALGAAEAQARRAILQVSEVEKAIKTAVDAAKAVDKVIGMLGKLFGL